MQSLSLLEVTEKFTLRYFSPFQELHSTHQSANTPHLLTQKHPKDVNPKKPVASLRKIVVPITSCWSAVHNAFDRIHGYFYAWPPTLASDSSHKTQVEGIEILQTFFKQLPGRDIGLSEDGIKSPKTYPWPIRLSYQLDGVDLNWFNELSPVDLKISIILINTWYSKYYALNGL